jgi:hypothetical protein
MDGQGDRTEGLRKYVEHVNGLLTLQQKEGYSYRSVYDYIGRNAVDFSAEPLSPEDEKDLVKVLKHCQGHDFRVKECYKNAYLMAQRGRDIGMEYCEGVGFHRYFPAMHAWVRWRGRALDVTWRPTYEDSFKRATAQRMLEWIRDAIKTVSYMGVVIPIDYASKVNFARTSYTSSLDDYLGGWPMLKEGFSWEKPALERRRKAE